jgi:hypothetical protein
MSAHEVWTELLDSGWDCLARWKDNAQSETLHLEFKRAALEPKSNVEGGADVKESNLGDLAKGASGFGNVDGGVIVFGAATKEEALRASLLDQLTGVKPIAVYAERMRLRIKTITSPPIAGIDLTSIASPHDPDFGVVAVYVPQNYAGPYRAEGPAKLHAGRYFMRQTNDTILAPHQYLAAMFGHRPMARLRVGFALAKDTTNVVLIHVMNEGPGLAQGTFIRLKVTPGQIPSNVHSQGSWKDRAWDVKASGWDMAFAYPPDELLYPGDSRVAGMYQQSADERVVTIRADWAIVRGDSHDPTSTGRD